MPVRDSPKKRSITWVLQRLRGATDRRSLSFVSATAVGPAHLVFPIQHVARAIGCVCAFGCTARRRLCCRAFCTTLAQILKLILDHAMAHHSSRRRRLGPLLSAPKWPHSDAHSRGNAEFPARCALDQTKA